MQKKQGLGFRLGTAPTQQKSILGVLLRAIYNHYFPTVTEGGGAVPKV